VDRLMNADEDAPKEYFIFVNELMPVTSHNFRLTGTFCSGAFGSISTTPEFLAKYTNGSARYLPFGPCEMDTMALSPYCLTAINDYRIEYDAESCRMRSFPLFPSRMSAIYAFGNVETCEAVSQKYRWPLDSVHRFRLKESLLNRVVRVNMEHVSLARHAYRVSMLEDIEKIWTHYWEGGGDMPMELPGRGFKRERYKSGVIWEFLIEGVVERVDHSHDNAGQRTGESTCR